MRTISGDYIRADGSLIRGQITFDKRIVDVFPAPVESNDYILPGLIDLQVNGSHGIDVMSADAEQLASLSGQLAREGCTAFLATAVTSPLDRIERVEAAIGRAIERSDEVHGAAILGMHLEGPFISPSRLGAHAALNLEPSGEPLERVLALPSLKLLTLAPELPGALAATRRLTDRGVRVSIGHTDATLDQARAGIEAGARMFTHLFNAMRPLHHREPGVIAAAFAPSPAYAAVIPDGVHVHVEMLRLAWRTRGAAGTILTSDKVALAGTAGTADLGRGRARIVQGAARLADGTIAGSIISMLDGVRLMVGEGGISVGQAAMLAASNPAKLLGLTDRGRIEVGGHADLLLLNRKLELKAVFVRGREI